jgi:hypothetical protein
VQVPELLNQPAAHALWQPTPGCNTYGTAQETQSEGAAELHTSQFAEHVEQLPDWLKKPAGHCARQLTPGNNTLGGKHAEQLDAEDDEQEEHDDEQLEHTELFSKNPGKHVD